MREQPWRARASTWSSTEREADEDEGIVVATDPSAGTSVPEGSTVTVFYSDGPEEVPDVVGDPQEVAEDTLTEAGFEVDVIETTDTTAPTGEVIRQSPEGGESAPEGSTVTIVVSAFEEPTEEPSPTEEPHRPRRRAAHRDAGGRPGDRRHRGRRHDGQRMGSA